MRKANSLSPNFLRTNGGTGFCAARAADAVSRGLRTGWHARVLSEAAHLLEFQLDRPLHKLHAIILCRGVVGDKMRDLSRRTLWVSTRGLDDGLQLQGGAWPSRSANHSSYPRSCRKDQKFAALVLHVVVMDTSRMCSRPQALSWRHGGRCQAWQRKKVGAPCWPL